ncbi:MAG TPA: 6-hydroxymethylpterin diphosphokinase MptE-like protein [Tepidisphaeraceae bacterium]|jgi:hypothetical protein|nr:6-hydroxymethylpterin diphosphokinase MptE-like protein [Tepidisphaeraceae bacterium]
MSVTLDPSRRFVLAADAPYVANLAALWVQDPLLAARIERVPDEQMYPVEQAKDGNLTVAVLDGAGKRIYLHSRYRPVEEAGKIVEGLNVEKTLILYIHGIGLGHHVWLALEKVSEEAIVVCFEADLKLLKTALWHRDFSADLAKGRLVLIADTDKGSLFAHLGGQVAMVAAGWEVIRHPASIQLAPAFHAETERHAEEFGGFAKTSINTLIINGRRTAENIARNVAWYAAAGGVGRLKDRYRGKPAVIVSAGPSLRKNKHLLKGLEDKAVLIAVQTTLQPLLEMGVEPHFVTSLDYHDISARFFEKLPKDLRTELVAEPKAAKVVLGLHPGPVTLLGSDYAERLLKEMKPGKGKLRSGATVAHLAFYLAEHLGCDPVIFLGQDLGFSDGLCYAPGTSYEDVWRPELSRFCTVEMKQWEQIVRERHILRRVEDIEGRPTYTEERLYTYLQQFERDFLKTSTKVIDSTEGGIKKRGTQILSFADAIAQHCTTADIQRHSDTVPPDFSCVQACRESLEKRKVEAGEIAEIARKTLPLLEELKGSLADQEKANRIIARIDELRGRMNELSECYELVLQITQVTELARFHRDREIAASRTKGSERQSRQIMRDIENVKAMLTAAEEFQKLMDQVIGELV